MKKTFKTLIPLLLIFFSLSCSPNVPDEPDVKEEEPKENPTEDPKEDPKEEPTEDPKEEPKEDPEPVVDPEPTFVDMELSNKNGLVIKFDKNGAKISSVTLDSVKIGEDGFIAGRVCNRIANGTFKLDGKTYNVTKNNGQHCLHGGYSQFGKEVTWTKASQTQYQIVFEYKYKDGENGFPGNIDVSTTYTLSEDGELSIEYRAKSDAKTLFNPTNHLYMNMNGISGYGTTYKNQSLWIDADTYTKAGSNLIPTGEIVSVTGTKLDYTTKKSYVGDNDSNLVLKGTGFRKVAELSGDKTNIKCEVSTDRVGLQLYNDNSHICLEAQDFPDAINHSDFPSIVLEANTDYYSKTSYKFTKAN